MHDETARIAASGDTSYTSGTGGSLSAPLGATKSGRVVFASGAANVSINANGDSSELYNARFEEDIPSVRVQEGVITIQYHRHHFFDWLRSRQQPVARIGLNPSIPWEIEFRDGLAQLSADLRQLQLSSLDMSSVSNAQLMLPVPPAAANIYLSGSASGLTLQRPSGVALRLQIAGAASNLRLDGEHFGAVGGGIRWQSRDYHESATRYEIGIAGSVSNLTVGVY
jgi:hypothetical protein